MTSCSRKPNSGAAFQLACAAATERETISSIDRLGAAHADAAAKNQSAVALTVPPRGLVHCLLISAYDVVDRGVEETTDPQLHLFLCIQIQGSQGKSLVVNELDDGVLHQENAQHSFTQWDVFLETRAAERIHPCLDLLAPCQQR